MREDPSALLAQLEARPEVWLGTLFPQTFTSPLASHHADFWAWVWAIESHHKPRPFVGLWPRKGGKSSSVEAAIVALGARRRRRYCVYVSRTQEQADKHVQDVAGKLESPAVSRWYPNLAERRVGIYGHARGWRRNRLWTADGFVVDAFGLDTAARGVKVEDQPPDIIVIDDIDEWDDSLGVIMRHEEQLTRSVISAATDDAAVIAIQNLVHPQGIFSRLAGIADEPAQWLADRQLSGPLPAIKDLAWEHQTQPDGTRRQVITEGQAIWPGQSVEACQARIDAVGIDVFLAECQHNISAPDGGVFDTIEFRRAHPHDCTCGQGLHCPALDLVVCWVDPAISSTDSSDAHGIQIDGLDREGLIWRLWSWERRASPGEAMDLALRMAAHYGASRVGIETDQGGDTWGSVYREASVRTGIRIPMAAAKAGSTGTSKVGRVSQMVADYQAGRIIHVEGTHHVLEAALKRFPRTKPWDLCDAAFWSWHDLRRGGSGSISSAAGTMLPD